MHIALDATYRVDKQPSGIAIYSREILDGLARSYPQERFTHCYRPKQYRQAPPAAGNVTQRVLWPWGGPMLGADIFHALNQRVDRRYSNRVVSTFHDLFVMTGEYSSPEFRRRFSAQAREAAERSDLIVAVSRFTASQVAELLAVPAARIRVVAHGAHVPDSSVRRAPEKMILTVGAIQHRKNTARLVEAFAAMPEDWRLILAGAPTGYGAVDTLAAIERSACRDRIQVAGYVSQENLERLYATAAIFAFPSLDEGFGIPVLEAMAHGVPVVTSNCSALPEVAGEAAVLIDPTRTDELASALRGLAADEALRERLSLAGRARAQGFTWQRAVEETYAVYREL